ncbi:MAG: helicase HerA-like domain-containing protein [Pseudomonadota bacterium]
MNETLFIGGADGAPQTLLLNRANRHGLVAGATGTGKTVTLQILAQGFAEAGVPVFCADVKGDLSGLAASGDPAHKLHDKLIARAEKIGLADYSYFEAPTAFWDLYGDKGHPLRTTVAEIGPVLLARMLDLNPTQEGVLTIAFALSDDDGLLLLDLKDLRALLMHVSENRAELSQRYGNIAPASVAAIQRRLLVLERSGVEHFFGEPALKLADMMRRDSNGRGMVNILDATQLIHQPRLYSTFLLWLMSELFEELPEVGDPDRPELVFFFDEAHLLFEHAPRALLQKVEQTVKLIRSKGVGIFFVTQNPRDIPEDVLAQLGTRVQHALRAYTPKERRAVKAAADSFRPNPAFDAKDVITELGVGEALVSTLDEKGRPTITQRTLIRPPASRLGPLNDAERGGILAASALAGRYDETVDRRSAYEILEENLARRAEQAEEEARQTRREERDSRRRAPAPSRRRATRRRSNRQGVAEAAVKTAVRRASTMIVTEVMRGLLGGLRRR